MELTWFRQPAGDDPGSLNLCFNAVDLQVVRGRAEQPAIRAGDTVLEFATLVEHTAALAGSMRGLGVGPGVPVAADLEDGMDRLLVLLAALRLGAVYVDGDRSGPEPHLTAEPGSVQPAVRAGRNDPEPCEPLPPDATAYVVDGEPVALADAVGHPSWMGRALATLCAGSVLTLASDLVGPA